MGKALDLLIAKLQVQSSNLTASLNDSNVSFPPVHPEKKAESAPYMAPSQRLWLFHDDKKLTLNSQTISESSLRDGDTVTIASGKQMQEKST